MVYRLHYLIKQRDSAKVVLISGQTAIRYTCKVCNTDRWHTPSYCFPKHAKILSSVDYEINLGDYGDRAPVVMIMIDYYGTANRRKH